MSGTEDPHLHVLFGTHIGTSALETIYCANFTLKFDSLDSLGRLSIVRSAAPANALFIYFLRTNHQPTANRGPRDPLLERVVEPAVHEKYE